MLNIVEGTAAILSFAGWKLVPRPSPVEEIICISRSESPAFTLIIVFKVIVPDSVLPTICSTAVRATGLNPEPSTYQQ